MKQTALRFPHPSRRQRGMTVMLVLWISIVMGLVYYSMMEGLTLETKLTGLQKVNTQAFRAAVVGMARANATLINDLVIDMSQETEKFDCLDDIWAQRDIVDQDVETVRGRSHRNHPELTYSVLTQDEESKININYCSFDLIWALIQILGYEADEARDIAEAIMDWRDPDTKPLGGEGELEAVYYAELLRSDNRLRVNDGMGVYISKNDMFTTLEELLDVYGVTRALYYEGEGGSGRRRSGRARAGARQTGRRKDIFTRLTRPDGTAMSETVGLRDFMTVWTNGDVNVNTAPREVLGAIMMAEGRSLEDALTWADEVIERRGGDSPDQDTAFKSIQEFATEMKLQKPQKSGIRALGVTSQTFRITAIGSLDRGRDRKPVERSIQVICKRTLAQFPLESTDRRSGAGVQIWEQLLYDPPFFKRFRQDEKMPDSAYEPNMEVLQWFEW